MSDRVFTFTATNSASAWSVEKIIAIRGVPLPGATGLSIRSGSQPATEGIWHLSGITSNQRYTTAEERAQLSAKQAGLGRPEATLAALIPIRKNAAWWELTQDTRRRIFEETSRHTSIGLRYLPAIARRLHHCRDFPTPQPFDFLTWFEFAAEHAKDFDALLAALRATEEWSYIEREVEVRLVRAAAQR
jgi:chlorite dismutase